MDMAILGASPARYLEYCQQVRQEFKQVDPQLFRLGRLAFLQNLLSVEKIFLTDEISEMLEKQALENVKGEVSRLS